MPRFCLSGDPQRLVACGVEAVAEEFLEYRAGIGVCEKFRERVTHRGGGDELGGRDTGPDSAQPRAERRPDPARMFHGEVLQDALTDEAHLDMAVVGRELTPHGGPVAIVLRVPPRSITSL